MRLPAFLRGMTQVARQEFMGNLKSVRFLIMALISALVVVGGSYGFSGMYSSFQPGLPDVLAWGHTAYASNGSHVALVWVSDPFGAPFAGRDVEFSELRSYPQGSEVIGTVRTDTSGFARLDVGNRTSVIASLYVSNYPATVQIIFPDIPVNLSVADHIYDFDNDGRVDEMALQVLNASGAPVAARVTVNTTDEGTTSAEFGYAMVDVPIGMSTVVVEQGGFRQEVHAYGYDLGGLTFASGPDLVLLTMSSLSVWIISIFAIVISFDAVSKERVQGTVDLLLSRPVSRTGVLLGKVLGAFAAVALPVTVVNLLGIAAISAASGKAPSGGFATAFVGLSLLLIAYYVLIQIVFSTLARSSGTAVLFGILVWLLFNILYQVVILVLGGVLFGNDPAAYYRFSQNAGLGNPSSIVSTLLLLASPLNLGSLGQTAADPAAWSAAAVVWFVFLLAAALLVFRKRAAQ